jgi:hypothetical protein
MEAAVTQAQRRGPRFGLAVSVTLHIAVLAGLLLWSNIFSNVTFVAAGPGEGGEGGGGSIDVGVADPSSLLGFAKPKPLAFAGKDQSPVNNQVVEHKAPEDNAPDEVLTPPKPDKPNPKAIQTDRPVPNQQERISTPKPQSGKSASTSAQVGHSFGNPTPTVTGGIGIGNGEGLGVGTGLPGGSEYGRRIQYILSRNFNPPMQDSATVQYAVVLLRISRSGKILSISGGRVPGSYFKKRSPSEMVNVSAERAILASDPLPPFPAGFLSGAQEATAEVWFRYPK